MREIASQIAASLRFVTGGVVALFIFLVVFFSIGCRGDDTKQPASTARPAAIVFSGDTGPWIVPCGCTANQSGGLLRRGTYLKELRGASEVVYADVGGAAAGTSAYFQEKFRAVLKGEVEMGVAAHNLGKAELAIGVEELRSAAHETRVPFISANARNVIGGQLLAEPMKIVTIGGKRVMFVGVVSPQYATKDISVGDPRQAVGEVLSANPRSTYDALIILAYVPIEELQQLAAVLPEADAVIGGPTGQARAPRKIGPVLMASATNKGKFLMRLDVPTTAGAAWDGAVVELGSTYADDAQQQNNLKAYLALLAKADFPANETGLVPVVHDAPAGYKIAGSQSCVTCHSAEQESWVHSAHAHAGQTLEKKEFHVEPYCQQCHSTGFALPGGFESILRTPMLATVGCESCHGPSQSHVSQTSNRTPFDAFDQCMTCHDHENSPKFERNGYWAKIRHDKKTAAEFKARQTESAGVMQ